MSFMPHSRTTMPGPDRRAVLPSLLGVAVLGLLALPVAQVQAQTQRQAQQTPAATQLPVGCPKGFKPRPAGLNPALGRCIPATVVAAPSGPSEAPEPPVGCPKGFKPRPAGLNPALGRCVPATIAAVPSDPSAAPEPPLGCPKGFKPRPPELNPALGPCIPATITGQLHGEPVTPGSTPHVRVSSAAGGTSPDGDAPALTGKPPAQQGGGPDRRDPIQQGELPPPAEPSLSSGDLEEEDRPDQDGPIQLALHVSPDLALVAAFQLGNAVIPWGNSANVADTDASTQQAGVCRFRYKYTTRNQGPVGAMATANRVMRDAPNGPVLAANGLPALAAGVAANSSGHLSLKPGTWMLYEHADAPLLVAESDEANNLRRVRVTVTGDCR